MKKMSLFIVLLFLLGLIYTLLTFKPLTDEERWELRRQAYDDAVECSGVLFPKLQFEQINWAVVPGHELVIQATDGIARLDGYFQIDTNTIWIPEANQDVFWIMKHEIMHAIGYLGHPDHPFRTCRLMADQQP